MLGIPTTNSIFETRSNYDARVNSHGAFVHDDWRVSDRLTLNLGLRYDLEIGLTEVENRNIGGFDLTTTNPDRRAGARQLRRESAGGRAHRGVGVQRSRRLHLSVRRSAVGVERGQEQLPAARGLHLQAHGKLRSAGRRRALHRAVSDSRGAGHHDRAQSNRVLAQHAGSGDQRQRADVPGESDQSHSERPAARAGRIGPGFDDQPRQRARERHARRSRQSRILAIQLRDRTSVPGRLPRRGFVSRSARTQPADPRNRELRAAAIPDAKPASRSPPPRRS